MSALNPDPELNPPDSYKTDSQSEGERVFGFAGDNQQHLKTLVGFPGGSEVIASAWNVGDPGSIPTAVKIGSMR